MRLRHRSSKVSFKTGPFMVRPLKPWILAAGVLVSATATANYRSTVDPNTPGLRFMEDPANVSLAWPTLTAPDLAMAVEDFIAPRPQLPVEDMAENDEEPQLQPGLWRNAQQTDGSEPLFEATPEISVLFRLGSDLLPRSRTFESDDGGVIVGAFSGLVDAPKGLALAALPPEAEKAKPALPAAAKPKTAVVVPLPAKAPEAQFTVLQPPVVKVSLAPMRPVPPRSPLVGTVTSEKEMKCLAEAIYFEARSEPERGQAGVAQVVLNRARSGVYPSTVCGVVYQNRHRYLACQFTFACEGKSLRITEPGAWSTATRIARDVAEGRTYLAGVGNATHYHANYVRPWWARHMDRREKVGKHIFYYETAEN
ncbi:MAG: cell wall hydrolase [Beijerinckiaceae bacterium]